MNFLKRLVLSSLLIGSQVQAAISDVDKAGAVTFKNELTNPGFENGVSGWTASGGTFTTVTSGTNFQGVGKANATWDSNAAAQTLTSKAFTITKGLSGTNGLFRCKIMGGGTETHTFGLWNGSTLSNAITITPQSTTPYYVEIAAPFGTSGTTVALRFTSVNANEPLIAIDDCYMGPNFNMASGVVMTDWQAYTPTLTGMGTSTNVAFRSRRVGDSLEVQGSFNPGTNTAVTPVITLGYAGGNANVTIDTAKISSVGIIGTAATDNGPSAGYFGLTALYSSSYTNAFTLGWSSSTTTGATPIASALATFGSSGLLITVNVKVPIAGWTSTSAGVRADNSDFPWTPYTPTLTNFGTSPTITNAQYRRKGDSVEIMGNVTFGSSPSGATGIGLPAGLTIDSTKIPSTSYQTVGTVVQDGQGVTIVPIAKGGQTTFGFGAFVGSGTSGLGGPLTVGIAGTAISWLVTLPIQGWTGTQSVPQLVGTVFSNTGGQERIERARIAGSGTTPLIGSQSGNWIASVARSSAGKYVITPTTGMFSAAPSCTCRCQDPAVSCLFVTSTTTIAIETTCVNASASGQDVDREIICMGPR